MPLILCAAAPVLIAIGFVDLTSRRIPTGLTALLLALGLARGAIAGEGAGLPAAGVGAAVGFGVAWALREVWFRRTGRDGLGGGDVKLVGALGAWVGIEGLGPLLLLAAASALVAVGIAALAGRRIGRDTRIPFGPFLAWSGFAVAFARETGYLPTLHLF